MRRALPSLWISGSLRSTSTKYGRKLTSGPYASIRSARYWVPGPRDNYFTQVRPHDPKERSSIRALGSRETSFVSITVPFLSI
jgi:hypothetical protein